MSTKQQLLIYIFCQVISKSTILFTDFLFVEINFGNVKWKSIDYTHVNTWIYKWHRFYEQLRWDIDMTFCQAKKWGNFKMPLYEGYELSSIVLFKIQYKFCHICTMDQMWRFYTLYNMKFSRHENFTNLPFWSILAPNACCSITGMWKSVFLHVIRFRGRSGLEDTPLCIQKSCQVHCIFVSDLQSWGNSSLLKKLYQTLLWWCITITGLKDGFSEITRNLDL